MIHLIAAVGRRGQLGLNGVLPWHDKEDLAWFRKMTMGKQLVVGWRTAQTLPPLPGRTIRIMLRGETPEQLLAEANGMDLWIAGGALTYRLWMPYIQRFHISRVAYDGPADTWMPALPFHQSSTD